MAEVLRLEGVSKHFGGVVAVEEFSMSQGDGVITGIIGPNGAGKTTVFNLITGVYPLDRGRIFFGDREITGLPPHRRTDLGIARTFQNIRLFRNLSVLDNLKVAHDMKVRYSLWEEMLRLPRVGREERAIHEQALHFLDYLQLSRYAEAKPANLPYGIQRRLDEPAAGLNPQEVRTLIDTIRTVREDHSLSVVVVEHHMELIMNICSHIHVLDFGRKIAEGRPEEIKKNDAVLQAYLGDET
jgi:ABC-type branched-subunit amino acid transport system ATPase component